MSDEERPIPAGDEPTGAIRWDGPGGRRWPRALGESASGEEGGAALPEAPPPEEPTREQPPAAADSPKPAPSPKKKPSRRRRKALRKKQREEKKARRAKPQPEPDPWEEERSYRPIRRRRDGRLGCLGGIMYALFIICASIVLAVFACVLFIGSCILTTTDIQPKTGQGVPLLAMMKSGRISSRKARKSSSFTP